MAYGARLILGVTTDRFGSGAAYRDRPAPAKSGSRNSKHPNWAFVYQAETIEMNKLIFTVCSMLIAIPATAQALPPDPYESWGVCPFECCTYREWTADTDIPVHEERSDQSRVLFRLRVGERVNALTGVVVTRHPAAIHIDHSVRDGYSKGGNQPLLSLNRGNVVYMLAPLGEGFYLFWYQGKVYRSGIDLAAMPGVEGKGMTMTWWKHVRNKSGKTGWTKSNHFQNADACG